MKARVLFGVFGFAFVLLALYVFPPIVLELVVAALCVFATYEVLGSTKLVRNHLNCCSQWPSRWDWLSVISASCRCGLRVDAGTGAGAAVRFVCD